MVSCHQSFGPARIHPSSDGANLACVWPVAHLSRRRPASRSGPQNGDVPDNRSAYDGTHERVQRVHLTTECTRRLYHAPREPHDGTSPSRPRLCPTRSSLLRKMAKLACRRIGGRLRRAPYSTTMAELRATIAYPAHGVQICNAIYIYMRVSSIRSAASAF